MPTIQHRTISNVATSVLLSLLVTLFLITETPAQQPDTAKNGRSQTVGDRLYLWGHRAGVYNDNFLKKFKPSRIEPVVAADYMGLRNMYFIRSLGDVPPPFTDYYRPLRKLDRVIWSLTGANGRTSTEEREAAFQLAANHKNLTGFIMDDFFHVDVLPHPRRAQWLAANNAEFPVVLTLIPRAPSIVSRLIIAQSDWPSGDYRSQAIEVEISHDGQDWQQVKRLILPSQPDAAIDVQLPEQTIAGIRLRILDTHDQGAAHSCGLNSIGASHQGTSIDPSQWKITATSTQAGFAPESLLKAGTPLPSSLAPEELRDLHSRLQIDGRKLPLQCVVYTSQITAPATHHLQYVDGITLWTWRPEDLDQLEENLTKLEQLVPGKEIVLGCYMFDFNRSVALSVERMKQQIDWGHRWLQQGRIKGIIFLASPVCDLDLEAVEFTRKWIANTENQPIKVEVSQK